MCLVRHPRKLVRPGQWVLTKVPEYLKKEAYDFSGVDTVYICIVPMKEPERESESRFEWRYRVYWRFPRELAEGEKPYWTHNSQYQCRATCEEDKYKDRIYTHAIYWDFDLIQCQHDHRVGFDAAESDHYWNGTGGFLYTPGSDDPEECPGEDRSIYQCSKCEKWVTPHSDDEGNLLCPVCGPVTGLVHEENVGDQIERARALASFVGSDCRNHLEQCLNMLAYREGWDRPAQTLLYNEDKFSFYFQMRSLVDGQWKRGMNGGLICHGPHVSLGDDGAYVFTTWDYAEKRSRPATQEEINYIHWSTHT